MSHRPTYTNRLIHEKSPYLRQHAHNPVDWYPWGSEAFRVAQDEGKPIFLSIGYATCHWCHVMEKESFESLEVAKLMNETFINIKVDREELPEVDSLYMEFAQAMMSGGAGWPLNLVLTPNLMPFFAATYLPADATRGFLGMKQLITRIQQIWENRDERENVESQAGKIVDVFAEHVHAEGQELPEFEFIEEAAELLFKTADPIYGGTKGAPKFPIGIQALFLLQRVCRSNDSRALFYVERTLEMMHRGGIYDHLGGGFARYSVDDQWLVPHFEKMLYDNAILARVYLEAWEYTRHPAYREISKHILTYLLRDLVDPQGGFYSAEDADTDGKEGLFYTWVWDEIDSVLGSDSHLFAEYYGVTPSGNFEGRNILHIPHSEQEFTSRYAIDISELQEVLSTSRQKLWEAREKRQHPHKDDKIIAAWNGLMIHVLARAGFVFREPQYIEAATNCARFIQTHMWQDGVLMRRWCDGEAKFEGGLDDYAIMIHGLLTLFEVDGGTEWLDFALALNGVLDSEFKAENGAYYTTNGKDPNLLLRRCEFYDGAEPSGNALQTENLLRLFQITEIEAYLDQAEDVLRAARDHIELYPPGACYHLMALERYYDLEAPSIVISLNSEETHREEIAHALSQVYLPHAAVVWNRELDEELRDLVPSSRARPPIDGKTTFYLCYSDHCELPLTDIHQILERIEKI